MAAAAEAAAPEGYKLELVQILFRHGARTCSRSEATMPMPQYVDQEMHDYYGYEQLTNIGKAMAHRLGCNLRKRYDDYLGPLYHPHDVYAYSSNTDRTKMSLQLVLAGLYPPAEEQTWNPELKWNPIPIHCVPPDLDLLLQAFSKPAYKTLLQEAKSRPDYMELTESLWTMNDFFEEKGVQALSHYGNYGCMGIFNVLNSHKASKCKLPDWFTDEIFEELRTHLIKFFDYMSLTPDLSKTLIGPLIKRMLKNLDDSSKETDPKKIYLYSGHELNIAAFTRAHDIQQLKYPDFSSAVILEKWRDPQNKLHVRMLGYNGQHDDRFFTFKLGDRDGFCPIEDYLKIIEKVLPTDEQINSMLEEAMKNVTFHKL